MINAEILFILFLLVLVALGLQLLGKFALKSWARRTRTPRGRDARAPAVRWKKNSSE